MKSLNAWYAFSILFFGIAASQSTSAQDSSVPVILWAETTSDALTANAGDTVTFTVVVKNDSAVVTATNPVVTINLPEGVSSILSPTCATVDASKLSCPLSELPPKASENLSVTANLNSEGHNFLEATVSADQENYKPAWRSKDTGSSIVVITTEQTDTSPVDLSVTIDITPTAEVSYAYPAVITLKNLHESNTAIAPSVELLTPEGWTISTGKHCDTAGQTMNSGEVMRCITPPLPPQSVSEINLFYTPKAIDASTVLNATANSTQPDDNEQNNTTNVDVTIKPFEPLEILCGASNPMCFGGTDTATDNTPDTGPSDVDPDVDPNEPSGNETDELPDSGIGELPDSGADESSTAKPKASGGGSLTLCLLFFIGGLTFYSRRKHFHLYR